MLLIKKACKEEDDLYWWSLDDTSSDCTSSSENTCYESNYPSVYKYSICPADYDQCGTQSIIFDNIYFSKNFTVNSIEKDSVCWYKISRTSNTDLKGLRVTIDKATNVTSQIIYKQTESCTDQEWEFYAEEISDSENVYIIVLSNGENGTVTIQAELAKRTFSFWDYVLIGALVFGIFGFLVTMIWIWIWIATKEGFKNKFKRGGRVDRNIDLPRIEELGHPRGHDESQVGLAAQQVRVRQTVRVHPRRNAEYLAPLQRMGTNATAWNSQD